MQQLKEAARQVALENGAELFGVADIARFEGLPPEHNPLSICPEARSVIVLGKRLVRGALRGVEEGTQFSTYSMYGSNWLEQFLAVATFQTAAFLEDNRWEAVPLMNLPTTMPAMGIAVGQDLPAPNVTVDVEHAAVAAGLGEIGYCGILLTPQFGPRQQLQVILTAAELEPDPIWDKPICDRCMEGPKLCPLGAISTTQSHIVMICGKAMPVGEINLAKCAACQNGARPNRYHKSGPPDRLAAICMRTCVDHLGAVGAIEDVPKQPFRRRDPWTMTPEKMWGLDERRHIE
jgi:epoxyqueuosine reductase QueG